MLATHNGCKVCLIEHNPLTQVTFLVEMDGVDQVTILAIRGRRGILNSVVRGMCQWGDGQRISYTCTSTREVILS